jgi:glycine/D-amino acid oxidase-like deaminating enzyme
VLDAGALLAFPPFVLRVSRPLWLDRTPASRIRRYPSLRTTLEVDVVIVGAGMTGVSLAWKFARAGIRVGVLEASRVGRGSTAASTALLMQEPDEDLRALATRFGPGAARRIWRLGGNAVRDLVGTLRTLEIKCDLTRSDSLYFTTNQEHVRRLRAEFARRQREKLGGRWLDAAALRRQAGIVGLAGIRTRGNALMDPYKACQGLARAAVTSGASIFERSPVRSVRQGRDGVEVASIHGTIHARQIIVATGYATPEFRPLAARFRMLNTYVIATRPLTRRARKAVGLGNLMLWSTGRPYHYCRWTPDHRLILGGGDRPQVNGPKRRAALRKESAALQSYFERLFGDVSFERDYSWEGLFAMTPDGLPYIGPHRRYPRHLFALGYGGNGMTFGFLAGSLLLDWYRGKRTADHDLFAFGR